MRIENKRSALERKMFNLLVITYFALLFCIWRRTKGWNRSKWGSEKDANATISSVPLRKVIHWFECKKFHWKTFSIQCSKMKELNLGHKMMEYGYTMNAFSLWCYIIDDWAQGREWKRAVHRLWCKTAFIWKLANLRCPFKLIQ